MEEIKEITYTQEFLDIINSKEKDIVVLDLCKWEKKMVLYNYLLKQDYISMPVYNNNGHYRLTLQFKDFAIAECVFEMYDNRYLFLNDINFSLFIDLLYLPTNIRIKGINAREILIYPEYEYWRLYIDNEYIDTYPNFDELKKNLESEEITKIEQLFKRANVRI